jgi:N utilization substance protein A
MQTGYESLVALPGIGISIADALYEKGFFSAEEISKASTEDLIQIRGIGEEKAAKLILAAKEAAANTDLEDDSSMETAFENLANNGTENEDGQTEQEIP